MENDGGSASSFPFGGDEETASRRWRGSAWFPAIEQLGRGKVDELVNLLESGVPIEPEAARILAMALRAGKKGKKDASWQPSANGLPFRFDVRVNALPGQKGPGRRHSLTWLRDVEIAADFEHLRRQGRAPGEAKAEITHRWNQSQKTIEAIWTKYKDVASEWLDRRLGFRAQMAQSVFKGEMVRAILTKFYDGLDRQATIDAVASEWRLDASVVEVIYATHEAEFQQQYAAMMPAACSAASPDAEAAVSPSLAEKFKARDAFLEQQGNLEEKSEDELQAIYTALGLQNVASS
jgi:hypothetical protein